MNTLDRALFRKPRSRRVTFCNEFSASRDGKLLQSGEAAFSLQAADRRPRGKFALRHKRQVGQAAADDQEVDLAGRSVPVERTAIMRRGNIRIAGSDPVQVELRQAGASKWFRPRCRQTRCC